MAGNKKISELSTAGTLTGTELVEIVQSGDNVKVTTQLIANLGGGSGITGVAAVGSLLRVLTVGAGDVIETVEASHIREDATSIYADIDSPSAYISISGSNSGTGDVAGIQVQPIYAIMHQQGASFELVGEEAFLKTTSVPLGGAGIIGVDATGKLFTTTAGGGTTTNPLTIGTGLSGTSFDGSAPVTIEIDAAYVGQSSITTLGTIATGVWNGTIVTGTYGGTGINNGSNTITLAGNLVTTGAFNTTLAAQASITTTLPPVATTLVGKTGTMVANYVPYWNDANQLTGSSLFTHTPNANASLSVSGASASRISIEMQNTTSSGNTSFYFQNNRGSFASYGGLFHGGSTFASTFFGVTGADKTALISDGASSLGLLIGTIYNQSTIIGTNNTARLTINGAGVFTIWDGGSINTGTTTGVKIGTATSQKIGFWNKTPIVQPTTAITGATLTGGGGTTITATDTFGGYTLQQIAAALINTGILA